MSHAGHWCSTMTFPIRFRLFVGPFPLLLLALTWAGCATRQAGDVFRTSGSGDEEVLLTVDNNDFRDGTIYAYWNGQRRRVGMVVGKTSETFHMRWRSEQIELEVSFIGGGGFRSEAIAVWEGDHLNWLIMPGY